MAGLLDLFSSIADNVNDFYVDPEQTARQPSVMDKLRGRNGRPVTRKPAFPYPTINPEADMQAQARDGRAWAKEGFMGAERRRREREDFMARQAAARRKRPQVSASDAMLTNEGIDTGEAARAFGDFVNHLTPVEKSPTAPAVDTSMLDYAGAQGIPEYTPEYVAQAVADVEAGRYSPERIGRDALWTGMAIPMTAMQMGLNTANLAAGGTLDPLINRFNEGTDIIKQEVASPYLLESERAVQEQIAQKDFAGALGTMAGNPGWVLSEAIRNLGSMAVPSAIGGATVKAAQALPWLGRLLPTAESAATFGSNLGNILMNAGSTMSDKEMQGLPLWRRYLAAGISGAGTGLIGAATEGGAEGQLARSIFGNEAAQGFNPFGVARSAFTEALQEGVEGGSDYAGQKWARGEPMSLKEAVVQNLPDMVMGGLTGAATHVGTNLANRIEQQEQADRMGRYILDTLDASKQQYEAQKQQNKNLAREYADYQVQTQDFARKAGQAVAEAERRANAATQRAENAEQVIRNVLNIAGQAQQQQMEGARNVANQQENMQQTAHEQPKQQVQAPETAQQQQFDGHERPAGAVQQAGDATAGQQGTEAVNPSVDNSTSYSFAGKKGADNLDKALGTTIRDENYALANHMEKGGKDPRFIKFATGWERGADGDWRYEAHDTPFVDGAIQSAFAENELDDAVNAYKTANTTDRIKLNLKIDRLLRQGLTERTTTVREMLGNDAEVVRAYPDIGDAKVVFKDAGIDAGLSNYDRETNTVFVNSKGDFRSNWFKENEQADIGDYNSQTQKNHIRGIIGHEIQHAIQEREGFARGGDPRIDGDDNYRHLAGENEGESTRKRMDFTREQRKRSLSEDTEKFPRSEQIVVRSDEQIPGVSDEMGFDRSSETGKEETGNTGVDREPASRLLGEAGAQEGNPAFRRALTTPEVRTGKQGVPVNYVRRVLNKTGLNDHLNVVQHFTDLPAEIQQRLQSDMDERGGDSSGIEGFYDRQDGKVYVIADNLSPERVAAVARHETIGHYAVELWAGKELMGKAIQRVNDALEKGSPLLTKLAREVDRRQPGLSADARAKEVIALMAEQNIHHPVTRRILDAIRRFLHKAGLIRSDVTDAEISKMLRDAEAWLKKTGNRTWHSNQQDSVGDVGTSFSMSESQQAKESELETQYDKAIKDNDMATAERIVKEYAELKGYRGDEYRGAHEAPGAAVQKNDFTNLDALQKLADETESLNVYAFANDVSFLPDDFFSPRGARMYGYDTAEGMESYRAVKSAMESIQNQMEEYGEVRDMPTVTVYRAVPKSVSEGKMRSAGEWVSPSRKYAKGHGEYRFGEGEYRIIRETVSAENLWWDGNDINEWGFDDGEHYSYKNTKNSRKLLDAVTYDSNGKPVPLSKRFNENKSQVYYSMAPQQDVQQSELTPPKDGEEAVRRQQEATTEANRNTWTNRPISDWDNIIRSGFNDAVDIQRTLEDIGKAGGKITEESDTVLNEELYTSRVSEQLRSLNEEGGPVHKIIELSNEAGLTVDEVDDWLYARHVILDDVNAKLDAINPGHENAGQLSGMTDEEAKAILDKHKGIPQLERIGRMVDSLMRQNVARLINGGLLTREEGKAWMDRYQHYVPLKRDPLGVRSESAWERAKKWVKAKGNPAKVEAENSHPTGGIPRPKGYEAKGKESQRRMGSKRRATNILANIVSNIEGAIVRVEKANVARSLLQLARDNPNPQFWHIENAKVPKQETDYETGLPVWRSIENTKQYADNVLAVKVDGREKLIVFEKDNPRAMAVCQKMKAADVASLPWVIHAVGDMTRWMGRWVTQHNPVFAVFNFVRDAQHMLYNLQDTPLAGKQLEVLKAYPSAFKGVWDVVRNQDMSGEFAQWYDEFRREGGETGFINLFANINDRMADLRRMQKQMQQGRMDPRRWGRALMTFIDDYNGIVENSTRLAVYVTARKNGVSPKRSASIAKNITVNFNRRGRDTNWANALYMFTNANLQGHARLFTALKKSKSARIIAAAMMGIGAMMDFVNRLVLGKDDDTGNDVWDEISDFEKDTNWIIPIPGGDKDKPYAKIPMPQGLSLLPNIGRILFQTAWLKLNGRPTDVMGSVWRMVLLTADAFNPFGSAADWMQLITPSFLRPLAQVKQNKSFTGNRLHREDVPNDGYTPPAYLRGWRNTPEHWKMMSKWLNDITGGDSITPGKINVPPETLRLLATSYILPGNSLNIDRAFNSVGKAMRGEEVKLRDMPVFSRVAGFAPDERIAEQKYHERMRELKEQHDRIKHYLKDIEKDIDDWKYNRISDAQMKEKLGPTREAMRRMGDGDVERGKLLFKRYEKFNETMGKLNKEMKEAQRKNDSVKLDRLKDVRTKLIKHLQLQDNDPSKAKELEKKWGLDLGA